MSDKKLLLAKFMWRSHMIQALRALARPSLVVLNYHRVRSGVVPSEVAFEEGVFGPSAAEFELQMEWISKNTETISEDDLVDRLERDKPFRSPSTLVTFDDGYVDNYETAYPILRKHSVPAIFFIPTGLISSRRVGWWDVVAYLVKRSPRESVPLAGQELSLVDRNQAIAALISRYKRQEGEPDASAMERLSETLEVPLPSAEIQGAELMSWDQIREVSRNGVAIGSHTHSHAALSALAPDAQREELRMSKEILERELRRRVRSVAYPFGGRRHYMKESMSLARECGYDLGFTFRGGANRTGHIERFGISRLRPPNALALMTASTLFPDIFA